MILYNGRFIWEIKYLHSKYTTYNNIYKKNDEELREIINYMYVLYLKAIYIH